MPIELLSGECDTGVVQIDSLRLDEQATIARAVEFYRTLDDRARTEAAMLARHTARLVISDAPPLACAAAAEAGIPSVVVTNFTWDWIYAGYAPERVGAPELVPTIQEAYRRADAAWRLPMHGPFEPFDTIIDVPFIARHARHPRDVVRRTLHLPLDRPLVLSSYGGYGVTGFDPSALDCLEHYGVILTHRDADDRIDDAPAGIDQVSESQLYDSGLRYEDLVAAPDIVATKPGYGIIAECIANHTDVLYTSRGHFVEYDVLVAEMPRFLRCTFIDHDALFSGRWRASLDAITTSPPAPERPPTNGAEVIAEMIDQRISD